MSRYTAKQQDVNLLTRKRTKPKRYHHRRRKTLSQGLFPHERETTSKRQVGRKERKTKPETTNHPPYHLLLHLIHLPLKLSLLLHRSALSNFLLVALTLDLCRHEILVGLQAGLDVDFEFDDVVEHALKFGVQLLADGGGAES
jgi:hypothetical protein